MRIRSPRTARRHAVTAAGLIGLCVASVSLAGCAEDRSHLLPGQTVEEISRNLDRVRELADAGDCLGAIDAAQEVTREIESLGTGVDARLRRSLRDGASRLVLTIQEECRPAGLDTPPADTLPSEVTPEPESTTGAEGATGTTGPEDGSAKPPANTGTDRGSTGGGNDTGGRPAGGRPEGKNGTAGGSQGGTGGVGPPGG